MANQLTIETFPKRRPNITLRDVQRRIVEVDYQPNNKDIRLAIDLAKQQSEQNPILFGADQFDIIRNILQCDISNERINAVKPFKKIIYKKVIIYKNGKHKTAKILRKRSK